MATAGARFTYMSSKKWNDPWYLGLSVRQRNLFDYLAENSDNTCAGVYQFDPDVARMKTERKGDRWKAGEFERTCKIDFAGHVQFYPENWVWVVNYLEYNSTEENRNVVIGAVNLVRQAPLELQSHFLFRYQNLLARYELILEAPPKPLPSPLPSPSDAPTESVEQSNPIQSNPIQSNPLGEEKGLSSPTQSVPEGYQACIDSYYRGFQAIYGTKPKIGRDDGALLKATLRSQPLKKVLAVISYAVGGKDQFLLENPPTLKAILGDGLFTKIAGKLGRQMRGQTNGA